MNVQEHAETARYFLREADYELAVGKLMKGSEMLWGAAAHAITAVARQRGWDFSKHPHKKRAVHRLADEFPDLELKDAFSKSEHVHGNFYHGFMSAEEVEFGREIVSRFVSDLLAMLR